MAVDPGAAAAGVTATPSEARTGRGEETRRPWTPRSARARCTRATHPRGRAAVRRQSGARRDRGCATRRPASARRRESHRLFGSSAVHGEVDRRAAFPRLRYRCDPGLPSQRFESRPRARGQELENRHFTVRGRARQCVRGNARTMPGQRPAPDLRAGNHDQPGATRSALSVARWVDHRRVSRK